MKTNNFVYLLKLYPNPISINSTFKNVTVNVVYKTPCKGEDLPPNLHFALHFSFDFRSLKDLTFSRKIFHTFVYRNEFLNSNKEMTNLLQTYPSAPCPSLCFENKKEFLRTLKQIPFFLYKISKINFYLKKDTLEKYQSFINNIQETQEDKEFKKCIKENHYENLI